MALLLQMAPATQLQETIMWSFAQHEHRSRRTALALLIVSGALGVACTADLEDAWDDREVSSVTQAVYAGGGYSWGVSSSSGIDLGVAENQTCFLAGVAGNLGDSKWTTGVNVNWGDGFGTPLHYEFHVDTNGRPLGGYARCIDGSRHQSTTYHWSNDQEAVALERVTPNRRCFLLGIHAGYKNSAFTQQSDIIQIFKGPYKNEEWWFLGGNLGGRKGGGTAQCFDIYGDYGSWDIPAASPGERKEKLAYNDGGVTCFLTGIQGAFTKNDYADGAYITYENGLNQYFLTAKNGKRGLATCVK